MTRLEWRAWTIASKVRFVLIFGTLGWGGSMVLLFTAVYCVARALFPAAIKPLHPPMALGLVGIVLLGGTYFGLRMWPVIQNMAAGRAKPATEISGGRKGFFVRQIRNLAFWIIVGLAVVTLANYIRAS